MNRRIGRDALIAFGLVMLAWGVLCALRPARIVEGSIRGTVYRSYPWQIGPRFDLDVVTTAGRLLLFQGLRGDCYGGSRLQYSPCTKPELPAGAPIRLVVHGFVDRSQCRWGEWWLPEQRRSGNCFSATDRIGAIEVNGQPVLAGWANGPTPYLLYALTAAGVAMLALNQWQIRRVSIVTASVYAFLLVSLYWGFAYY